MKYNNKNIALVVIILFINGCAVISIPILQEEITEIAKVDTDLIYGSQEPILKPLTLSEALARALKYNLNNRVKLMEEAIANKSFDLAKMDMLPILAASAGYFSRDNVYGSSSLSLLTGRQSLEPSTSQDKAHGIVDIRFAWNILDFGVSYLQAKQDSDRYLISKRGRSNVMLKLLQQVRATFWRAAVMQDLLKNTDNILEQVRISLIDLQKVRDEQLRRPIDVLNDIRALLEIVQQLEQMQDSINAAQIELATLINSPPGKSIELVNPIGIEELPSISEDVASFELTALVNSDNYATEAYNVRIERLESRKSLMRLLPGIEFSYSKNYDSNSFLVNQVWGEAGIRATGDLMRLFFIERIKDYGKTKEQLSVARRLAVNMATITQVHLSWQNYQNTVKQLQHAKRLNDVDQEISMLTQESQASEAVSGVNRIQNEIRAFRSKLGHMLAIAETQDALGAFIQTLGINPIPDDYQNLSVVELANKLMKNNFQMDLPDIDYNALKLSPLP
ncbi:MAG: multidrug efflux system outer membrane protein [Gammaproteobacteria bacterium]|jgi:multidrug efflux system outer membrane protein